MSGLAPIVLDNERGRSGSPSPPRSPSRGTVGCPTSHSPGPPHTAALRRTTRRAMEARRVARHTSHLLHCRPRHWSVEDVHTAPLIQVTLYVYMHVAALSYD